MIQYLVFVSLNKQKERNAMKRLLTILFLGITIALGQTITPIADIQYVADPATDDASPMVDSTVTISGVVTAEFWGSSSNKYFRMQDADTAWSGITIYNTDGWDPLDFTLEAGAGSPLAEGDSVTVTGVVYESWGKTRIRNTTNITVHGPAVNPPAPIEVSTLDASQEKYEKVLLKVTDVDISNPDLGSGDWSVTDGSGDLIISDKWDYYYYPKAGDSLATIVGTLEQYNGSYKLMPRLARDVVEAGPFTRIQRIQQVLGSALYMTPDSNHFDKSYFFTDTVTCIGVVIVPVADLSQQDTSVSPIGGYSRFVFQDPNGGPFSAMQAYDEDASAFPELFVGDSIIMTGWIAEYNNSDPANFTEMEITSPVDIIGVNANIPDRPVVSTSDLRLPITAEQWEFCMVRIEDAVVIANYLGSGYFSIDDGSGSTLVEADRTNIMRGRDLYGNTFPPYVHPPPTTAISSLEGFIYHRSSSYSDSTTYKVAPVHPTDIVLGGGPPSISGFAVTESPFGLSDAVTVSATITDESVVASAVVAYRVNGGVWTDEAMTEGTADIWSGTIPATDTEGALVEYFIKATDNSAMSSLSPDTSVALYGYHTRADGPTIYDIQYTPFEAGDTYYTAAIVSVSGVVTSTANQPESRAAGFNIQDGTGIWNGIWADTCDAIYTVTQGDSITITGTVIEDHDCTAITAVTAVTVHASGKSVAALDITGAEFITEPEKYECILLHFGEVTVTDSGNYDKTVTDDGGTTEFLIDDDFMIHEGPDDMYYHGLDIGAVITDLSGICHYYYGEYLVMIRDPADLVVSVSVADGNDFPLKFSLSQNYPNPFNPTTTIEYSLARHVKHTLKVYNLRGALVATLVNDVRPAGAYSVTWNANNFASGMYFLRLDAEDFQMTRKLIMVK